MQHFLELEKLKRQLNGEKEEFESDGFMEALKGATNECLKGAGDFIET